MHEHVPSIRLRVREVAQEHHIDQAGLVSATGLSPSTIQEVWDHPTHDQDLATIVVLACTLGVSLNELVEGGGRSASQSTSSEKSGPP